MDRGAWWATVHGIAKSQTRLSDITIYLDRPGFEPAGNRGAVYHMNASARYYSQYTCYYSNRKALTSFSVSIEPPGS